MFRYCPRCAAPDPQFLEGKKILCPSCGFQIYHNTAAAVAVLIRRDESYVFLRRARDPGIGLLDLPGGFVDPGESAEEACRREVREEIGAELEGLRLLTSAPNTYPYKGIAYNTCDLLFLADCHTRNFRRQEDEVREILLLRPEKVPLEELAFDSIRNMLAPLLPKVDNLRVL